jgi:hypothetical protein
MSQGGSTVLKGAMMDSVAESTFASSRVERVRRGLLTACLVLSPTLIATSFIIDRVRGIDYDDRAALVETAAANPGLWQLHMFVGMLGFLLLVPAVFAIAEMVRRRHPALALIALVLAATSAILITGAILFEWALAAAAGLDVATIAEFDAAIDELSGMIVLLPGFFAGPIGFVLLGVGLWRARTVHQWVPVALVAASVLLFIPNELVGMVSTGLLLAAFLGIAWFYGIRPRPAVATIPEARTAPPPPTSDVPRGGTEGATHTKQTPPASTPGG